MDVIQVMNHEKSDKDSEAAKKKLLFLPILHVDFWDDAADLNKDSGILVIALLVDQST